MQTEFEVGELVLIKNGYGEYFTTAAGVPTVYLVYQVSSFLDKPKEYVMQTINCPTTIRTTAFTEDRLDVVPSSHPVFTVFGVKP
jgi:ribosomal protein L31